MQNRKPRVVRVVTASYVVPWHLGNTLKRITKDFDVCVVGQNVSIYAKDYPGVEWFDIDLNRKISIIADFSSLIKLIVFLRRYKPDIVHSIMPKAGLLAALAGIIGFVPVRLHTFTGQVWVGNKSIFKWIFYVFDWLINKLNTVCLTDSPSQSKFLFDFGISHYGKPLPVLGIGSLSGVDLSRFNADKMVDKKARLSETLHIKDEQFVFAFVARKTREKGAFDVLQAFSRLVKSYPDCLLLFVGPDESDGELAALSLNDPALFQQVISVGQVDNHEAYLAIADVLCLPSYREGFGTIVIDAAAMAKPTIGSDIVGLVDSIDNHKTGLLFPAGDVEALAEAMMSFLVNSEQLDAMGTAARNRAEKFFSADILYDELKKLYFDLCKRSF
ncbi:glycosyltransferase [Methylomonas sp. SURF-2]|uniref:Glycosyltransferase n=1 Tax=Methylomonas subterranea TaxID=2952225 RepID=A0ABT1TCR4_9GAMM|nr:glycosyltransferase [Methylomonas sp. SURF-2]MCQ8103089.1 glycosyltransferase [Methylomonas sp. SURF-2]